MKAKLLFSMSFMLMLASLVMGATSNDSYHWLHAQGFNGMNTTGMVMDNIDNTYFYGFSYHDINYDKHSTTIDYATEKNAIVVVKLNALNEYQWTKKINVLPANSTASFNVRAMDVDDDDNMYFGGDFMGLITVNEQTFDVGSSQGYFMMKVDPNGNILWFKAGRDSRGSVHTIKYTAGRVAFVCGWTYTGSPELFGTDLMTKFGSIGNFVDCDMMVGGLSPSDGHIVFAQGIKTQHTPTVGQLLGLGIGLTKRNILVADTHGNLYVSGGFNTNTLKVAGVEYTTENDPSSASSQFVLRVDIFGGISWVKLLTHASGFYPTLAVHDDYGVAALFPGQSNAIYIDDQVVNLTGDVSKYNHVALFDLNGALLKKRTINSNTWHISPSLNGGYCVAGNIKSNGQYFGMDGLLNPDPERENLFVGFLDEDLNPVAGQSVISTGRYIPSAISTGTDDKIRLLGNVNYTTDNEPATFPFGDFDVANTSGSTNNTRIFSVLDPKQLIKGEIFPYAMDCGIYEIFLQSSLESKIEWYVNDEFKGSELRLSNDPMGYKFEKGDNYIKAVLTDLTDSDNTITLRDTVTVYDPIININTEIFPETGLVNYSVTVSNYSPTFYVNIDRGNYDYDYSQTMSGSYTYEPGTHTITVILNNDENHNCFHQVETTFEVPEPSVGGDCNDGSIRGHVDFRLAQLVADEIRVDLFNVVGADVANQFVKSDTIDSQGFFSLDHLPEGSYILRANIINPDKYPSLLVTYFNYAMNQVVAWQDAAPIELTCNQWADLNLTFAAIYEVIIGTGSISGIISYSEGEAGSISVLKSSTYEGDVRMDNVPILLRRKLDKEIVARTITDENGMYSFEKIAEEEYEIIVDIPGVPMESSYTVVIAGDNDKAENRNFTVSNSRIKTSAQVAVVASISGNGSIGKLGANMLNVGESIEFVITPNNGYAIQDVLVNDQSIGSVSSYKFESVASNQTIHAIFSAATKNAVAELNDVRVYPQIISNYVQVINCANGYTISVFDELGRSIHTGIAETTQEQINCSAWTKGFYLIRINNGPSMVKTFKVIKH